MGAFTILFWFADILHFAQETISSNGIARVPPLFDASLRLDRPPPMRGVQHWSSVFPDELVHSLRHVQLLCTGGPGSCHAEVSVVEAVPNPTANRPVRVALCPLGLLRADPTRLLGVLPVQLRSAKHHLHGALHSVLRANLFQRWCQGETQCHR